MMTGDCVGCNALTTMTDEHGRFLTGQAAAVVGPRFGGITSCYHLAYGPRKESLCGRIGPSKRLASAWGERGIERPLHPV
jgi:hypothetical protein